MQLKFFGVKFLGVNDQFAELKIATRWVQWTGEMLRPSAELDPIRFVYSWEQVRCQRLLDKGISGVSSTKIYLNPKFVSEVGQKSFCLIIYGTSL